MAKLRSIVKPDTRYKIKWKSIKNQLHCVSF